MKSKTFAQIDDNKIKPSLPILAISENFSLNHPANLSFLFFQMDPSLSNSEGDPSDITEAMEKVILEEQEDEAMETTPLVEPSSWSQQMEKEDEEKEKEDDKKKEATPFNTFSPSNAPPN